MTINIEEIKKVAKLAKLYFSDEEMSALTKDLTNIMQAIDLLNEIDCSDVEPLTSTCDMALRMRADEVKTANIADQIISNAPGESCNMAKDIKCFIVPKVVE